MKTFTKTQTIILAIAVIVLIVGGIAYYYSSTSKEKVLEEVVVEEEEVYAFPATVSEVGSDFLIVKPAGQEKEVKVNLNEDTKLIKLEFPFDTQNPPENTAFTPKQTEITISGFKEGDQVFIKTTTNIAGKTEFDNVDFIHIFP